MEQSSELHLNALRRVRSDLGSSIKLAPLKAAPTRRNRRGSVGNALMVDMDAVESTDPLLLVETQCKKAAPKRRGRRGSVGNSLMDDVDIPASTSPNFVNYGSPMSAPSRSSSPLSAVFVAVGSNNPVKLNAAEAAFKALFPEAADIVVRGFAASSGVPDQPTGDTETLRGAENRAVAAYHLFTESNSHRPTYAVGIEGGIGDDGTKMDCFAHVSIYNGKCHGSAKTASFVLPTRISELVRGGLELGEADDAVFGTANNKQGGGTVGHLTNGLITRTDYYVPAVLLANSKSRLLHLRFKIRVRTPPYTWLNFEEYLGEMINPLLTITGSEIGLCSRSWKMWDIVARGVNFGVAVGCLHDHDLS